MLVDRQTMIWRRALDCNPGSTVVGDRDAGTTWRLVHALVHAPIEAGRRFTLQGGLERSHRARGAAGAGAIRRR